MDACSLETKSGKRTWNSMRSGFNQCRKIRSFFPTFSSASGAAAAIRLIGSSARKLGREGPRLAVNQGQVDASPNAVAWTERV